MKRVFDVTTVEDVNTMKTEKDDDENQKYYNTFIVKAGKLYQENDKLFNKEDAMKTALSKVYNAEGGKVWEEFDPRLGFGDHSPCRGEECWYSRHSDRLGGATFYYNRFNEEWVVCDVCVSDSDNESGFDEVFAVILSDTITDMKNEMKKKRTKN